MQDAPKIVRERLKGAPAVLRSGADSSPHPDADLLTAFSERTLPEFERTAVLEHLSRCGDCREIVALALPALDETAAPVPARVRTSPRAWLSWPAVRWGVVAAGVVAISTVGALRHQRQSATAALKQSSRVEVAANEPRTRTFDRLAATEPKGNDKEKDKKENLQASAAPASGKSIRSSNSAAGDLAIADSAVADSAVADSAIDGKVDEKKSPSQLQGSASAELTAQVESGTNRSHGSAVAANTLPHGPRVANQWQQGQQQNTVQDVIQNNASNKIQNTPAVVPPPSAYPAAAQVATNTKGPSGSETVEVARAAPTVATEARNIGSDQGRDLATIDRAKAPVAAAPANPAASGSAGAVISRPNPGGSAAVSLASTATGEMFGYVFDPSGAVVPNVRITVTPSNSKAIATAVTDSKGAWLIAGLPTGTYKAQAEAPGFKTTVLALNYDANQPSPFRLTLDVGSVAETVEVTGAAPQIETETATIANPVNGRNLTELNPLTPGVTPRWIISAAGELQRSVDRGKTWRAVDVSANPASLAYASSSAASLQVSAETSLEKVKKDKNAGKFAKQKAGAFTFRAVAAAGSEVWAGGSGGALYHSADAGNSWARIVPASAGTTLTGDVLSIDFADAQHGKVSTSTAEVWSTADGGLTWQKP